MKLAQALSDRADLQKRIEQVQGRLLNNAKVQEGEQPAEDPAALLAQLDELTAQLQQLITRINLTNAAVLAEDGQPLTALLAQRDCLNKKLGVLRRFVDAASSVAMTRTRTEIKIKSALPVPPLQAQADDLAKQLRLLDGRIQALNWTSELR